MLPSNASLSSSNPSKGLKMSSSAATTIKLAGGAGNSFKMVGGAGNAIAIPASLLQSAGGVENLFGTGKGKSGC